MIIAIQGSKNFQDYQIFLRAMGTALSTLEQEDKEILIFSAGTAQINSFAMEFSNISERSLKARGIKIKVNKVPPKWIEDNIHDVDYFAYFCKPKETVSHLVDLADAKDVAAGVYRF